MANIRTYFEKGFPNTVGADATLVAEGRGTRREINLRIHLDFSAHAIFVSLLFPELPPEDVEPTIGAIVSNPAILIQMQAVTNITLPQLAPQAAGTTMTVVLDGNDLRLTQKDPDGLAVNSQKLTFTRRAYVYLQQEIDPDLEQRLRQTAVANDLIVSFRGPSYATEVSKILESTAVVEQSLTGNKYAAQPPTPEADAYFMRLAIEEAKRCTLEPGVPRPRVGAVVVKDGTVLATAYRGETKPGDHAEFVALERKLRETDLSGATVYTTLEPCTSRGKGKIPCAQRLIQRGVRRVVVAMLDPNLEIQGEGWALLHYAGVKLELLGNEIGHQYEAVSQEFFLYHRPDRTKPRNRVTVSDHGEEATRIVGLIRNDHRLFSVHRGAMKWGNDLTAVYGNDGYYSINESIPDPKHVRTHRQIALFRAVLEKNGVQEVAFKASDDGATWVLLVRSTDADMLAQTIWACFMKALEEQTGDELL